MADQATYTRGAGGDPSFNNQEKKLKALAKAAAQLRRAADRALNAKDSLYKATPGMARHKAAVERETSAMAAYDAATANLERLVEDLV